VRESLVRVLVYVLQTRLLHIIHIKENEKRRGGRGDFSCFAEGRA
jgi:hypothetical protein